MEKSDFVSERLKLIQQPVKDTVFGFIRNSQCLLLDTNSYYNIPFGVSIICLIYYSPPLKHGIYDIEGNDESESERMFKAKYELEFIKDGTIFGTRGNQLICGGWDENNAINFMLTWRGACYQYNGYFDTILNEMNGKWHIKDDIKKKKNTGQYGVFKYKFKYKSQLSQVQKDPNNVNNRKLHQEYQTLLQRFEIMRKNTAQIINSQDAEIFALKLVLLTQMNEIDECKKQINELTESKQELKMQNDDDDNDGKEEEKEIDYNPWEWQDIMKWIINENNGKYRKYESVLKQKLCEEELKGEHLRYVDKNDLHRFGIVHFADKVEIYQLIQQLISGSTNI